MRRGPLEFMKRVSCLAICVCFWFILHICLRILFLITQDPSFEMLEELGGAVDDKPLQTITMLPLLRPLHKWLRECKNSSSTKDSNPDTNDEDWNATCGW